MVRFLYTFNEPITYNKYYNKRVWLFVYLIILFAAISAIPEIVLCFIAA